MGYQQIDIGGFFHPGKDRTEDYYQIFPEKPIGLSILDIGCHNGFYILKAISEGAEYALGIDKIDNFLKVGENAKKYLKYDNIDFRKTNILENGLPQGEFDVVLCLNILHYFNISMISYLLNEIDKRCKKVMIFEILYCEDMEWKMVQRRSNVTALSIYFFRKKFPNYNIETMESIVTENRMILKVKKDGS
jgi:SAM-dependent methyltransferase